MTQLFPKKKCHPLLAKDHSLIRFKIISRTFNCIQFSGKFINRIKLSKARNPKSLILLIKVWEDRPRQNIKFKITAILNKWYLRPRPCINFLHPTTSYFNTWNSSRPNKNFWKLNSLNLHKPNKPWCKVSLCYLTSKHKFWSSSKCQHPAAFCLICPELKKRWLQHFKSYKRVFRMPTSLRILKLLPFNKTC